MTDNLDARALLDSIHECAPDHSTQKVDVGTLRSVCREVITLRERITELTEVIEVLTGQSGIKNGVEPNGERYQSLRERAAVLEDERSTVWKWVERGLFDNSVPATNALGVLARSPFAPWSGGRWDVDHKPYAVKFYKMFPKAALNPTPVEEAGK